MYEFEVKHRRKPDLEEADRLRREVRPPPAEVKALALIPWEEHCTECAAPACYETCALYQPRSDGRCRRFVDGFVPVPDTPTIAGSMVQVSFKRWAELTAYGNARLVPLQRARRVERALGAVEAVARELPGSGLAVRGRRGIPTRLTRRLKQFVARRAPLGAIEEGPPDRFLAEVYNPNPFTVRLSVTMRNDDGDGAGTAPPFQALVELPPGFEHVELDAAEIAKRVDLSAPFVITLNPNILEPEEEGLRLMFGVMSFVRDAAPATPAAKRPKHVKVLAWDLDNTLWDGTVLEDGAGRVTLRAGVADVIRELDRRGVVNTAVSKGNERDAMQELARLGLDEYFVFPKIDWRPKSVSLQELIEDFNVGADAVAFIDDLAFEREEVSRAVPGVRVYSAADYAVLPTLPEFSPPQSSESAGRREFYRSQGRRKAALSSFGGDYEEFLRSCHIRLSVRPASIDQLDRIDELTQRTNQLNFSGTRYSKEAIAGLLAGDGHDCFAMSAVDDFGDYGTVGFAVVETDAPRLTDLMLSCRIQGKRVEHAFLEFLLSWYGRQGRDELAARYVETERNAAAGRVFADLGFELVTADGAVKTYRLAVADATLGARPVSVYWEDRPWSW